jgi:hypothetical protein
VGHRHTIGAGGRHAREPSRSVLDAIAAVLLDRLVVGSEDSVGPECE